MILTVFCQTWKIRREAVGFFLENHAAGLASRHGVSAMITAQAKGFAIFQKLFQFSQIGFDPQTASQLQSKNSGCDVTDGEWKRNPLKKVVGDLHPTFGNQDWSRLEWSGASYVSFPWLCTGVFIFWGEGHRIVFFVQRKMTHSQNHPQGFYLPRASLWICGS